MLKTPTSSREHREEFTKNYKQLIAVDSIGYLADLMLACLKPLGPLIVNGTKYESDGDVVLKAEILRNAWEKMLDVIHDQRDSSLLRTGLLIIQGWGVRRIEDSGMLGKCILVWLQNPLLTLGCKE